MGRERESKLGRSIAGVATAAAVHLLYQQESSNREKGREVLQAQREREILGAPNSLGKGVDQKSSDADLFFLEWTDSLCNILRSAGQRCALIQPFFLFFPRTVIFLIL